MVINDLIPHENLGQQKAKVLDAQDEAFHILCVKQYMRKSWGRDLMLK